MENSKSTGTFAAMGKMPPDVASSRPDSGQLPPSGEDRHRILVEWNRTSVEYPADVCLHGLIEAQTERTPDAVAVVFEDSRLTYRELNARANTLAHELRSSGVGPETLVAVCMDRSLEMVVGLLGILKAGGAYVPLDPNYPQERLSFMLEDANAPVVLTQSHLKSRLLSRNSTRVICLDEFGGTNVGNPCSDAGPGNLAYVIYTSGSTGEPKGAMNTHRGICNRLLWMQDAYGLTHQDRILQKTPFTFDVSVWEFFWPLMFGAQLVVARPGGHMDSAYLTSVIREQGITTLHFVPPMLSVFLADRDAGKCNSLKRVICSGEALPAGVQRRFFEVLPHTELHNLYGPTEAAVDVTAWACKPGDSDSTVPIGRPVANTQIYILDEAMQPVPAGAEGELHIGGVQVARGYLGRPELTAQKFVADPFSSNPKARLYKTGDLARFREDGNILFLGRIDHQVKLRGFRIELGEIESALAKHTAVRQCAVIAREDRLGDKRLVAYIVRSGETTDTALSDYLKGRLPEYMVPAAFVFMKALPVTANGKLDRKALPAPAQTSSHERREFAAPRNTLEKSIADVWASVLQVENIGINDNFFDAGGNSLKLILAHGRLREDLKTDVPITVLFEHPTINSLADFLGRQGGAHSGPALDRAGKQREALARRREVRKAL